MEVFNSTLTQMLVLFTFIAVGFVLRKAELLPDNSASVLSKLESYFLVPAMILESFTKYCRVDTLSDNMTTLLYSLVLLAFAIVLAIFLSGFFAREKEGSNVDVNYQKSIYKYALSFGNFAFMGNALVLGVFGEAGLFKHLIFTIPLNAAVYTWGVYILIPKGKNDKNPLLNLLNPIIISLVLGVVLGLLNVRDYMPKFITTTLSNAQSCMGPIAMILTGFVIGGYNFKELLTKKRVYTATALRLIVIPAVMMLVLKFIGTSKEIMTLALFAYSTPLGLNTVVIPAAYDGDTKTGASMAMISHTFSVITLPIMYLVFITLL